MANLPQFFRSGPIFAELMALTLRVMALT